MSEQPFSVVVPHRNRPEILRESLDRLRSCWPDAVAEILVVDDASDEDLVPSAESLGALVRVLRQGRQIGPAACRNQGARVASNELLLFLDDDSWPVSGDWKTVARRFAERGELAAVGLRVLLGSRCESGGAFNAFVACGAIVRREALLQVGGFPESFGFYAEEYAVCYAFLEAGYEVRMWSEPAVFHRKTTVERDQGAILSRLAHNNRRLLEPHRKEQRVIDGRLREILSWYRLLARRYDAEAAVEAACAAPVEAVSSQPWSESLWERIAGGELLRAFARSLAEENLRRVSLWPVGKDCASFAAALKSAGIEPLELLDPSDRFGIRTYAGMPVASAPSEASEAVVVASFSPGLCWNAIEGNAVGSGHRIVAGFDYVDDRSPPELIARRRERSCISG